MKPVHSITALAYVEYQIVVVAFFAFLLFSFAFPPDAFLNLLHKKSPDFLSGPFLNQFVLVNFMMQHNMPRYCHNPILD
jgi:hypothetical protein